MDQKPSTYFRRNRLRIVCLVVFLLPLIWAGTRRTLDNVNNDLRDWLPDAFTETSQHAWFLEHFPNEQFVLISWNGCTLDDPRMEQLAQALVPDKGVREGPVAAENGDDAVEETASPFKTVLTGPRLIRELKTHYSDLSDEEIIERLESSLIGPENENGERYTCVVVTLSEDAVKGKQLRATLAEIHDKAREVGLEPEPPALSGNPLAIAWNAVTRFLGEMVYGRNPSTDGIVLGGPPVDNEAINYEGEYTLWRLAGLCAFVALAISWFCFRSIRLTLMVFWLALLSAGVALAGVFFSGGTCDAVLLSMPALVLVLAMSGAIHIINYYHDAIRDHDGLYGAPERAVEHGWFPCAMASLTTALGLGSLCMSHVIPISKFGIYSAFGVLAALPLLFLYLPALLDYFPSKKYAELHAGEGSDKIHETRILSLWRWFGGKIVKHNIAVSLLALAFMGVCAVGLFRIETSVKLMKLFAEDAEILAHYTWLEGKLGPGVPMEVVVRFDNGRCELSTVDRMRLVGHIAQQIEQQLPEDVGGALSAATMAPDLSNPRTTGIIGRTNWITQEGVLDRQLTRNRWQFREYLTVEGDPTLEDINAGLRALNIEIPQAWIQRLETPGVVTLHEDGDEVVSLKDIEWMRQHDEPIEGFTDEELAQLDSIITAWQDEHGTEIWRINTRVWALKKDIDYAVFVNDLKAVVDPIVAEFPGRYAAYYNADEKDAAGIDVVYTGLVPLVYKTQHVLLGSLVESLLTAFILICIVMILVLKSPQAGLLSMIPNMFPVVVIFGAMGWIGVPVDIGTMMTSTVALGVAVDDTMHFLTWFRHGLDQGKDRKGAVMVAYERCATAMTQTTLIGGLGLAAFGFSTFTPTQRFGVLMLVLLFTALIGDLIFLPALLTSPLGKFFDRRKNKAGDSSATHDVQASKIESVLSDDAVAAPKPMDAATLPQARDGTTKKSPPKGGDSPPQKGKAAKSSQASRKHRRRKSG